MRYGIFSALGWILVVVPIALVFSAPLLSPLGWLGSMPQTTADLQEILDNIPEILENFYTPESTSEGLAAGWRDVLEALGGEDEDAGHDEKTTIATEIKWELWRI